MILELANALRSKRENLGITQKQLSELSGISYRTIQSMESGNTSFSVKSICQVADVLGLELTLVLKNISE